jgi:hypothetical protein
MTHYVVGWHKRETQRAVDVPRCQHCRSKEKFHDVVYDVLFAITCIFFFPALYFCVTAIRQLAAGAHTGWTWVAVGIALGMLVLFFGLVRLNGRLPRKRVFLRAMSYPDIERLLGDGWKLPKVNGRPSAVNPPAALLRKYRKL